MNHCFFSYKSSQLHYSVSGKGGQPIICLHGYGESLSQFGFLQVHPSLENFIVIAIDLPCHGKTAWQETDPFTPEDLHSVIAGILMVHLPDVSPGKHPWIVAGYSMGGRIALSLYQHFPKQIGKLILLAPDGLKISFWYWLATQTSAGNRFFAFTMKKPQWFYEFVKLLYKAKILNASIVKFVNYYIGDPLVRQQLYDRWTTLRKFKPSLPLIKKEIRQRNTKVRLIFGIHDRIILSSAGKKFCKGIETQSQLTEIHAGHQVLHEKHVKEILPAFLQ